jgi:lipopolysaccharide transport protein LptA
MKYLWLMLILLGAVCRTQAAPAAEPQKLVIHSDRGGFDMTNYRTFYQGHVRADDPRMHLTSECLTADLPRGSNADSRVVATTNVVMALIDNKGQTNHGTSDQAVYNLQIVAGVTNETVTLSGHATMWNDKVTIKGEPLVYDMVRQELVSGTNWETTFNHDALDSLGGTNSASHKTNSVPRIPGF